jgi:hypothetical protein
MWGIQCTIRTSESLKLAESYRLKINREHPKWKWSRPLFTVPPRSSRLYNPERIARRKIGESATLERLKFDYVPGKSAELLVASIRFNNKGNYLTALGKTATSKSKPQIAHTFSAALSISFSPEQISIPAQRHDGVYSGWGFCYGLPMPPSSYEGEFPRHYLGVGLDPDKNIFFFTLDPAKSPKELPSFNEFQNMLRRSYPLEGLVFLVRSSKFSGQIEDSFIELIKQLISARNNDTLQANRKTP